MAGKVGKKAQITAAHVANRRLALQHDILQWSHIQAVYMPAVAIARSSGNFLFEDDSVTVPDDGSLQDETSSEGMLM
jgi:hypothetical protein